MLEHYVIERFDWRTIKKKDAVDRIVEAIKQSEWYDLHDYHNELFPAKRINEEKVKANPASFLKKILAYIHAGLEVEEILALWNVVFARQRNVWFDEEEDLVHYQVAGESLEYVD